MQNAPLLDIQGIATLLLVSPKTIYRWVRLRKIPFIKLEHHIRFDPDEVLSHFQDKTKDAQSACTPVFQLVETTKRSLKSSEKKAALSASPKKGQDNGNN